ncbi:MAG: hypothetical protein MUC56_08555 [Thermoanaerobaculales bacterium]|jgi:tetratricopeptide (TPR) repeat protein|nr:hypothetical protein [Thermoanaerobaculales bacterium]
MNHDDESVERLSREGSGSLAEVGFAELLFALARHERSVSLQISRPPLVKEIVIESGVPIDCRSNLAHETLSRFLQSSGELDETTANDCFAEACSRGILVGDVLLERGLFSADGLRRALQRNLARKLLDGFSWLHGEYRLGPPPAEPGSTLKVNVAQLIVLGVTRFATRQQVDASVGPLINRPLALHPAPFFDLGEIRLTAQQRSIVAVLEERPMRLDEIAATASLSFEELTRTIHALALIGVVLPADRLAQVAAPTAPRPPQRPATRPLGEPDPLPDPVADPRRAELAEMILNLRRKDAFELLGVDPGGSEGDQRQRFVEFAERFAPWTYPGELAPDAARVFLAGARAFADLDDPRRRQALLDRRRTPDPTGGRPATSFRIETDLLDPAVQHRRGRALMAEGNYREAIEQLAYASDLDPQNGDYRAELAYCRYLYNPQAGGPPALDELAKASRIDPASGLVHFYRGEILRRAGRVDEAGEAYRRAIKPMAPDRRPIDALRALQRTR